MQFAIFTFLIHKRKTYFPINFTKSILRALKQLMNYNIDKKKSISQWTVKAYNDNYRFCPFYMKILNGNYVRVDINIGRHGIAHSVYCKPYSMDYIT